MLYRPQPDEASLETLFSLDSLKQAAQAILCLLEDEKMRMLMVGSREQLYKAVQSLRYHPTVRCNIHPCDGGGFCLFCAGHSAEHTKLKESLPASEGIKQ